MAGNIFPAIATTNAFPVLSRYRLCKFCASLMTSCATYICRPNPPFPSAPSRSAHRIQRAACVETRTPIFSRSSLIISYPDISFLLDAYSNPTVTKICAPFTKTRTKPDAVRLGRPSRHAPRRAAAAPSREAQADGRRDSQCTPSSRRGSTGAVRDGRRCPRTRLRMAVATAALHNLAADRGPRHSGATTTAGAIGAARRRKVSRCGFVRPNLGKSKVCI
ncbi:hypothetical protein B0H15DRAFT_476998 [Mycena belliarum]|uniref:Uncharacterized protein n=1 Tax=Mycena belliarum TaxID=1033014 RepID=A0AAD6XI95_9AGAR|nr:hypothetical protein B0H15DRAFT_476998 [Mycena belliae]